ncbi:hypothetical protein [Micromonospora sp. AKA38]|uniref:hypothetical protein n=1 Tax=Micromonospora sp. AKA38 TaxID=2733861 RepID=UPI0022C6F2C0|nr:hypothetical protein [Micromonospora sp. AKA38]GHJ12584.1 hypothetical protein TPA0908_05790 [Micromonospora sp. AKA38]
MGEVAAPGREPDDRPAPDASTAPGGDPGDRGRADADGHRGPRVPHNDPVPPAGGGSRGDRPDAPPATDAAGTATAGPRDGWQNHLPQVMQVFNGQVTSDVVGVAGGEGRDRRPVTGKLEAAEVDLELGHFIPPSAYDAALEALLTERVVVLCGATGSGKRTSALGLLRDVTHLPLVVLSSVITLKELAQRSYEPGYGYLVVNHQGEGSVAERDFTWRTVRDRIRECEAYLVVTTADHDGVVETVRQFPWHRPDLRAVLRGWLAGTSVEPALAEALADQLTDEYTMGDVARIARRVAAGEPYREVLAEFEAGSASRVQEWFDKEPSVQEVLEVTVLAFLEGVNHRTLEAQAVRLERLLADRLRDEQPGRERPAVEPGSLALPAGRRRRTTGDGLISSEQVSLGVTTRPLPVFRRPEYRRHILAELCRRYDSPFWDAMREWLQALVVGESAVRCAQGLAWLAAVDFDEVEQSYLHPWSRGEAGWTGQTTAAYLLWWMCLNEETTPAALGLAKYWASHGNPQQRWTAAMAYGGELGIREPTQAVNRLWHLVTTSADGDEEAASALAMLFATLTVHTEEAGRVVSLLTRVLRRPPRRPADARVVDRARLVLFKVLLIRDPDRGELASFMFLDKHPERVTDVSTLWAEAICNRPHRETVLNALWSGLHRLGRISATPVAHAHALAQGLAAALPPAEALSFQHDFRLVDVRRGNPSRPAQQSLALVLLDVLERYCRAPRPKD